MASCILFDIFFCGGSVHRSRRHPRAAPAIRGEYLKVTSEMQEALAETGRAA